ncbi:unnamed protein product [Camellia sinensis]
MMTTKAILCFFVLFFSTSHGQSIIRQPIPLQQSFNINKTHGGSIIRLPLPSSSFNINKTQSSSDCSYTVTITTSCSSPKYTRDQISLSFGDSYGYQVYAARIDDPSSGAFERCSVDTYEITGPCLYEVCYLYLYRSGYDGWIPDTVEVYGYYTGSVTFYYQTSIPNDVWYGFNYCNGASSSTSVGAMRLFGHLFQRSGIKSKLNYTSGFFHNNIKLLANDCGGIVTAFYLKSEDSELDFEFLGNRKGKPIGVQMNVFLKGKEGREQRIHVCYFVDGYLIRVFKNNRRNGVGFPTQPMQLMATIWDGNSWATNGGKTKIIWVHAPFISHFRGFAIDGCPYGSSHRKSCNSSKF